MDDKYLLFPLNLSELTIYPDLDNLHLVYLILFKSSVSIIAFDIILPRLSYKSI